MKITVAELAIQLACAYAKNGTGHIHTVAVDEAEWLHAELLKRGHMAVSPAGAVPDWSNAPNWANYAAMDADGSWFWFEAQPMMAISRPESV